MERATDLYGLLGVRLGASQAEIRRAFQKRARALHPDLNPGDPAAAEHFRHVSQAFEVLSDAQRRAEYDRSGRWGAEPEGEAPQLGFVGFDFSAELSATTPPAVFRDLFASSAPQTEAAREPAPGEHLEQVTRLSFEEVFRGTRRRVHLVRQETCPACLGAGDVPFGPLACPQCSGRGERRTRRGSLVFRRACEFCRGRGQIDRRPCRRCGAAGRAMRSEWLDVEVPPGVDHGSRVLVPGAGNAGQRGGPPGDFSLVIEVEPHPFYRREGQDLHCAVPVSLTEAALGGHIEVPTPDGPVTIEVPVSTQTGQRFRLRKRGLARPGGGERGDLYVEVRVEIPRPESERARELLLELERLQPSQPRAALSGWDLRPGAERR